jgi:phosphoglycolate phosphatase-like HAD superfamily hydrolase
MSGRALLRGIVFDLDGTLTAPHAIDFARLRLRLNLQPSEGILQHVAALPSSAEREKANAIIIDEETKALEAMRLNKGVRSLLETAEKLKLRLAIATRNNAQAIDRFYRELQDNGLGCYAKAFAPALARGAECAVRKGTLLRDKPHGDPATSATLFWGLALEGAGQGRAVEEAGGDAAEGVMELGAAQAERAALQEDIEEASSAVTSDAEGEDPVERDNGGVQPHHKPAWGAVLMVGDHRDDLLCGRAAGCMTCLMANSERDEEGTAAFRILADEPQLADYVVDDCDELAQLIERLATE